MLKWILGGAAVVFLGPTLLRKLANEPELLNKTADMTDRVRGKAIELTKRGAAAIRKQANQMNGAFAGVMCGACDKGY